MQFNEQAEDGGAVRPRVPEPAGQVEYEKALVGRGPHTAQKQAAEVDSAVRLLLAGGRSAAGDDEPGRRVEKQPDGARLLVLLRQAEPRLAPLSVQPQSSHAATDVPGPDLPDDPQDENRIVSNSQLLGSFRSSIDSRPPATPIRTPPLLVWPGVNIYLYARRGTPPPLPTSTIVTVGVHWECTPSSSAQERPPSYPSGLGVGRGGAPTGCESAISLRRGQRFLTSLRESR